MTPSDYNDLKVTASDALEFEPVAPVASKRRFGFKLVVVLVVVGGGAGAWGLYGDTLMQVFSGRAGGVPLIKALPGPVKVRPENPGGLKVPNRDKLVYDRMNKSSEAGGDEGRGPERLLPSPEQPLPKPAVKKIPEKSLTEMVKPAAPKSTPITNPLAEVPTVKDVNAAKRPPPAPPAAPSSSAPSSITPSSVAPKASERKPAPASAPAPAAAPVKAVNKTELAATAQQTAPVPRSNAYLIQLAAARSSQGARTEWDRLKTKNKDLLGSLGLTVTMADLGPGKGIFYRLRAGPIASEAAARTLCQQLTKRQIGCLIIKPAR
ncbi:MAG: SPOR domain-containing protein [Proteobacteria bacterium]|nr:SPOR domain-containing protein [Pseudomonadota bacterium]